VRRLAARKALDGLQPTPRRGNPSDFLLSGVVRCGHCGKAYIGMSARGNGGRYQYYACTGRQKYGPRACRNDRLARAKLEQAVLAQLASVYRDGDLIAQALARAEAEAERTRPEIEHRLGSTRAEIARAEQARERYYEAFEQGKLSPERCEQRLTRLQARLDDLHGQHAELAASTPHGVPRPDPDRRPAPLGADRARLHQPLQRAPPAPLARAAPAAPEAAAGHASAAEQHRARRPARRSTPRVLRDRRLNRAASAASAHASMSPLGHDRRAMAFAPQQALQSSASKRVPRTLGTVRPIHPCQIRADQVFARA
jgi:Recombinase zinc beta ribbon domain